MTTIRTIGLVAILALATSACAKQQYWGDTEEMPKPVGIGEEPTDLKRSPCACAEVPQDYSDWTA